MIAGFRQVRLDTGAARIACSIGGEGPPVLLLHGFPQTHAMWHAIAPVLARDHLVVAADLRGYGDSTGPATGPTGVAAMSFREMAGDQAALMAQLGHDRFHLVGHDRGARTAHRLALDHPDRLLSLTLMDIIPTHALLDGLRQDIALAYYHWFFLAQPAPLPESMIGHDPDAYFQTCLGGLGGATGAFDPAALEAYRTAWRRPQVIAAMCDDYRAAIQVDFALDAADLGRRVACPSLVLYGADGAMGRLCDVPAAWAPRLADMRAQPLPGGHFFPDQHPEPTAAALCDFLRSLR